jgi:dynein heavy chain, axonemal
MFYTQSQAQAYSLAPATAVLFPQAVEHVCRLTRALRQPHSSALLLGHGGSGKQSLARLAIHVAGLRLFELTLVRGYGVSEFRQDLQRLFRCAMQQLIRQAS